MAIYLVRSIESDDRYSGVFTCIEGQLILRPLSWCMCVCMCVRLSSIPCCESQAICTADDDAVEKRMAIGTATCNNNNNNNNAHVRSQSMPCRMIQWQSYIGVLVSTGETTLPTTATVTSS
jgi:hypothetical protein